ncbi:MAG TPA: hypothetical protein VFZ93_00530 [Albitalea sp.]
MQDHVAQIRALMALELRPGSLDGAAGTVRCAEAFRHVGGPP